MNASNPSPAGDPAETENRMSALFANLVVQQTELAMMLLGQGEAAEGEAPIFDLDHARMVIDQLEMLEFKTRGNLTKQESALLEQSLMMLRMTFVEAANQQPAAAAPAPDASVDESSKVRFTKKY